MIWTQNELWQILKSKHMITMEISKTYYIFHYSSQKRRIYWKNEYHKNNIKVQNQTAMALSNSLVILMAKWHLSWHWIRTSQRKKNNGSSKGIAYFECSQDCGVLSKKKCLTKTSPAPPRPSINSIVNEYDTTCREDIEKVVNDIDWLEIIVKWELLLGYVDEGGLGKYHQICNNLRRAYLKRRGILRVQNMTDNCILL